MEIIFFYTNKFVRVCQKNCQKKNNETMKKKREKKTVQTVLMMNKLKFKIVNIIIKVSNENQKKKNAKPK